MKINNLVTILGSLISVLLCIVAFFLVKNFESQDKVAEAVTNLNVLISVHAEKLKAYDEEKTTFKTMYFSQKTKQENVNSCFDVRINNNEKDIVRLQSKH